MKVKTTKFFFICLWLIGLSLICSSIALAQPSHVSHEDPGAAQGGLMAHSVFDAYSTVFQLVSEGDFDSVSSVLGDLDGLELPEKIRDALDLYRELVADISGDIEDIGALLEEVERFEGGGLLAEAMDMLGVIGDDLDDLNTKTADLSNATEDLKIDLADFIINSDLFQNAYQNYLEILTEVDALNESYQIARDQLEEDMQSDGKDTFITISVPPDEEVFVGDEVTLSGRLTYSDTGDPNDGLPLTDREIKLYLDNLSQVVNVNTDADGYYSGQITIPYDFKPGVTLNASYAPSPVVGSANHDDFDVYKASYREIEIEVSYHDTEIELDDVPSNILVGYSNTISGLVSGEEGVSIAAREIHFYLNRDLIATCLTDAAGSFSVALEPAAAFHLGTYTLRSVVLPDNVTRSNGKTISAPVELIRVTPEVEINAPRYVIASMPRQLSGNVSYQQQPVQGADVIVFFGNSLHEAKTDELGDFEVMLESPALSLVMGNQSASVFIEPSQSWLNSVSTEYSIISLSVINMSYFSVFMVAMGVMVIRRMKTPASFTPQDEHIPDYSKPSDVTLAQHREGVLSAYYEAAAIVGELTGVKLTQSVTLREYIKLVDIKIDLLREPFIELTHIAEFYLYSVNPKEGDIELAQQLLDQVKGGLVSEPA